MPLARGADQITICRREYKAFNVIAETAIAVVVLAVHIRRNRAADGDEFGARDHGGKEAPRQKDFNEIGEQHSCFNSQPSVL